MRSGNCPGRSHHNPGPCQTTPLGNVCVNCRAAVDTTQVQGPAHAERINAHNRGIDVAELRASVRALPARSRPGQMSVA